MSGSMSRANVWRGLVALAILAVSVYFAVSSPPRLGLDLRGGTQIVLEARGDAEETDRAVEVLRRRVDALGVAEPVLTRSGESRIIVELPDLQDPTKAREVLGKTAQLTFHPVDPGAGRAVADEDGQPLRIGAKAITGGAVSSAEAGLDQQINRWNVNIAFQGGGGAAWARLTGTAACAPEGDPARRVAIVLDGKVISSPQVNPDVSCEVGITGGSTQITGSFTEKQARDLAALIQGGALPVPVELISQQIVGPSLGAEAIDASVQAALIGAALTGLFILVTYRLFGGVTVVALAAYALISYAVLTALGATLTLPGLAGFVLAIGMAVDANVLVLERAREEYVKRPRVRVALAGGFKNAWSAIIDSNVTTLLASGLLFFLASGPVRGFGVTLTIGVLASMVSALIVARALSSWLAEWQPRPALTGIGSIGRVRAWMIERSPDLMGRRRLWLGLSAAVVVVAMTGIAVRGVNLGVEFTGGRLMEYATSRPVDAAREAVSRAGFPQAVVQETDGGISVRTGPISGEQEAAIRAELGNVAKSRDEFVGPSLGDELRTNALIAFAVAITAQLLYLAFRFRWAFAAAAVASMFQVVLLVVGLFAWLGKPVDGIFLAAMLTVIGYSVNDAVVTFDRIRETGSTAPAAVNQAILQTVPRTVNTGLGAIFILAALAVLGGDSLTDFAIALLAGIIFGTFSSVFTASPLVIELDAAGSPARPPRQSRSNIAQTAAERQASTSIRPTGSRTRG